METEKHSARRSFDSWWPTYSSSLMVNYKDVAWVAFGAAWVTQQSKIDRLRGLLEEARKIALTCVDGWPDWSDVFDRIDKDGN